MWTPSILNFSHTLFGGGCSLLPMRKVHESYRSAGGGGGGGGYCSVGGRPLTSVDFLTLPWYLEDNSGDSNPKLSHLNGYFCQINQLRIPKYDLYNSTSLIKKIGMIGFEQVTSQFFNI